MLIYSTLNENFYSLDNEKTEGERNKKTGTSLWIYFNRKTSLSYLEGYAEGIFCFVYIN